METLLTYTVLLMLVVTPEGEISWEKLIEVDKPEVCEFVLYRMYEKFPHDYFQCVTYKEV